MSDWSKIMLHKSDNRQWKEKQKHTNSREINMEKIMNREGEIYYIKNEYKWYVL